MRRAVVTVAVAAFAVAGTSACATRGYVRTQVGQVNSKVDSLSQALEETQQRTQANEQRISEVDTRAGAAQTAADAAGSAAKEANTVALAAGSRAEAVEKAVNRIVYEVVLAEDQGNFRFGSAELPDEAKARIDELITQIKADPKGHYFEIEGHTDNVGPAEVNKRIGLERAEAVKAYLYEQHQIPLHRMNVISYGEEKPAQPNDTREGRAANRRVVIRVLG